MRRPRRSIATCALGALLLFNTSARAQTTPAEPRPPSDWSPAKEADPPLLPDKATTPSAPLSTSGSDVSPSSPTAAQPLLVPSAGDHDHDARTRIQELEARVALDEARLKTLEKETGFLRNIKIQGFIQLQYRIQDVNAAASPNLINGALPAGIGANSVIAKSDGTTTNTSAFRLRRTRLRVIHETDVTRFFLQIDAAPIGGNAPGLGTIARNAEVTGIANWTKTLKTEVTGGLFMVPFRRELYEISLFRPFIERSWAAQNMFPTERDIGVHVNTTLQNRLSVDVGVLNGQRLGESRFFAVPDLNRSKDFYTAVLLTLGPATMSLHGYAGTGVVVDPQQLRVKNYPRYGLNFGMVFGKTFFKGVGETRFLGELAFTTNMDSGVNYAFGLPAIPARLSDDVTNVNQRALYVRLEQDITRWALAGFRYDTYTLDTSVKNNARDTYTFMAGAKFSKLLRWINEVSWAIDNIHPENTDAPSRHIFQFTSWLQGSIY